MKTSKEWTQDDSDTFLAKIPLRHRDSNPRTSNLPAVSPFGAFQPLPVQPTWVHEVVIMLFRD